MFYPACLSDKHLWIYVSTSATNNGHHKIFGKNQMEHPRETGLLYLVARGEKFWLWKHAWLLVKEDGPTAWKIENKANSDNAL